MKVEILSVTEEDQHLIQEMRVASGAKSPHYSGSGKETNLVELNGQTVGYYSFIDQGDHLSVDDFYINPDFLGLGARGQVREAIQLTAERRGLPVKW